MSLDFHQQINSEFRSLGNNLLSSFFSSDGIFRLSFLLPTALESLAPENTLAVITREDLAPEKLSERLLVSR